MDLLRAHLNKVRIPEPTNRRRRAPPAAAMDLPRAHLNKVRIPEPTNRIHKDECCVSFDTPGRKVLGGVCTFQGDGEDWGYAEPCHLLYAYRFTGESAEEQGISCYIGRNGFKRCGHGFGHVYSSDGQFRASNVDGAEQVLLQMEKYK